MRIKYIYILDHDDDDDDDDESDVGVTSTPLFIGQVRPCGLWPFPAPLRPHNTLSLCRDLATESGSVPTVSMVVLMQKMAIQSPEKCGNLEVFSIKTLSLYRESGFRRNIMEYWLKMLHSLSTGLGGINQTWRVLQFIAVSWWEWNTLGKIVVFFCWAIPELWWCLPIWQVFWVSGSFTMFRNILPLTNPRCHHDCHCLLQTRHDSHRSRVNDFRKRCAKGGAQAAESDGCHLKNGDYWCEFHHIIRSISGELRWFNNGLTVLVRSSNIGSQSSV